MYSKEQLLKALQKEFTILKHLWTKVEHEQHLTHQFTDKQRTIKELMMYLAFSIEKQVQLIVRGEWDAAVYGDMGSLSKDFDPTKFDDYLDIEYKKIHDMIEALTSDQLATQISLFGATQTRAEFLVGYLLTMLGGYKMQLFLQLKHAWRAELGTSNLWGGVDPK